MPEKTLNEIPRNLRELYEKGNAALQKKNYDYAIAIYNQILAQEPAFYPCREALRATQRAKSGSGGGFFKKIVGTASASPNLAKAQVQVRTNPIEALGTCEQVLSNDPNNSAANKLLAEAAMALDFPKTAVLSLEIAFKNSPRDKEVGMRLGEALGIAGQISRAEVIYSELQKIYPNDPEIDQAIKNLAAKRTMRDGGYDALSTGAGSYRDILKDQAGATALEQEGREVKSDDVALQLIRDYHARLEKEPGNKRLTRSIGDLYVQRKDYDKALEYYRFISDMEGGTDPALEQAIIETEVKRIDREIARLDPADDTFDTRKKELERQRDEFRISEARKRVEKYPNDLQLRFELGKLLFEAGLIKEAIPEFQKAQVNPHKKVASLYFLGECFARRNMNDLAAKAFQSALAEKPVFDEEKKQLVYSLGSIFERMGKPEDAMNEFKKIYEIDIEYRDVAQKVDAYYSGGD